MDCELKELNSSIQKCTKCMLYSLKWNLLDVTKGYGKLLGNGGKEILVVAQNPSINRFPYQTQAMGVDYELVGKGDYFRKKLKDLGIDTSKIYWTNIVKCSTENNCVPDSDIIIICREWLVREIEILKPKKIVAMGNIAYEYLQDAKFSVPLSKIWHYAYVNRNLQLLEQYEKSLIYEFS